MNIIISPCDFNVQHMFFTDTKNNIMMEGIFKKIIYSNESILLNGIFIEIPKIFIKETMTFFIDLEKTILRQYKTLYQVSKKENLGFQKQVENNTLRVYKERQTTPYRPTIYVIKISGVWETHTDFGLTYKIIEKEVL